MTNDASIQERIVKLQPSDLPAPPNAAATIVRACSDPEVGAQRLGRIVASDPILTAELLRTVNSAFFAFGHEIRSAAHAVTVLGNRALRNLALCLAVRDSLKHDAIPGFDMVSYWEDALRRAVGAKLIAELVGFDSSEAFTIGLLQDFGMLATVYALPEQAEHWIKLRGQLPNKRLELEQEHFGITHDKVGHLLAKSWALPEGISVPMAYHHSLDARFISESHEMPCRIAATADWLAAVFSADDKKSAIQRARVLACDGFNLDVDQVDTLLGILPKGVEEAAESLGLRVEEQPTLELVMREANRTLIQENTSYQELTWRLERALSEKELLANQLKKANEELERLAYADALTGLVNRRRFLEAFPAEVSRHGRSGRAITLLMVDLDNFKKVNDTYGHPFGDTVIEAVAESIKQTMRNTDIKARIGGEEMCIVLPECDHEFAAIIAERLRKNIDALRIEAPTRVVPITASIGGCTWSGKTRDPQEVKAICKRMLDAADAALYDSKNSGRNRVSWRPYTEEASAS
ncbi:MAG TPA: HDOD domain-containing protein [Myxococcales bacterium]|nr:HDOD domain-containing protein [Myxococcales bacterium]HIN85015.1 HDOD domain-containing protein [Myxococcales bacterium]